MFVDVAALELVAEDPFHTIILLRHKLNPMDSRPESGGESISSCAQPTAHPLMPK